MLNELFDKLEKDGKLKKKKINAVQIDAMIKQALLDLLEANKVQKVSERSSYLLAYMAILKAVRGHLMREGYVPDHGVLHNILVEVMREVIGDKDKELTGDFEVMRRRSNEIIYEAGAFITKAETDKAFQKAKLLVDAIMDLEVNKVQKETQPVKPDKPEPVTKIKIENLKKAKPEKKVKPAEIPVPAKNKSLIYKTPPQIEIKEKPVNGTKISFAPVTDKKAMQKVEDLAREIWNEYFIPIIGEGQVTYMLEIFQSQKAIEDQISKGYMYFLIKDAKGKDIGYFALLPEEKEMLLSKFYLLKAFRKKGTGKTAMNYIYEIAKEKHLHKIYLTVNKRNIATIETYKKYGFMIMGQTVTDIGGGFVMDDYKMEKWIGD